MGAAIPSLAEMLNSKVQGVPSSATSTLVKLAENSEQQQTLIGMWLTIFKVEFRDAIGTTIPSLVELLKSNDYSARSSAASALAKLAEKSE
jgi:HEAT repeat protein